MQNAIINLFVQLIVDVLYNKFQLITILSHQ